MQTTPQRKCNRFWNVWCPTMIEKRIFTEKDLYEAVKVTKYGDQFRARVRIGRDTVTQKYTYKAFYGSNELDVKVKVRDFAINSLFTKNNATMHRRTIPPRKRNHVILSAEPPQKQQRM